MKFALIGGTGLYDLGGELVRQEVTTPYGTAVVYEGEFAGRPIVFLARHGVAHDTPPHRVPYRANLAALKQLGVTHCIASSAVGTLSAEIPPGTLALLTDFIDQTEGRARTFFDQVLHLDYTTPYCPRLRAALSAEASTLGITLAERATYLCTNGPRFETPAEIRMYRQWGADLVGMTNVPEVVLAREAEICYAAVAIATNDAAGVTGHTLTHGEVEEMMTARLDDLRRLLAAVLGSFEDVDCPCRHALDEYRGRMGQDALGILG